MNESPVSPASDVPVCPQYSTFCRKFQWTAGHFFFVLPHAQKKEQRIQTAAQLVEKGIAAR